MGVPFGLLSVRQTKKELHRIRSNSVLCLAPRDGLEPPT
jgi:hypothetical protein